MVLKVPGVAPSADTYVTVYPSGQASPLAAPLVREHATRHAVSVEPPRDPSHGDLATTAAMVLAKEAKSNPRALAEHIVETKAGDFDPSEFVDQYEVAVVDLLKKKQAGIKVTKETPRLAAQQTGNVIDLLKRSLEIEKKGGGGRKTKAPALVPTMPKAKKKQRAY